MQDELRFYKVEYRPLEQKPIMELLREDNYGLDENHPAILRIKELEEKSKPAGSHHGNPDLSKHDMDLLEAYNKWINTATKAGYDKGWLPSYPDIIKSRLFWRIRSGQEPLKYPPPRAYSCPWYELIEVPGPHDCFEEIRPYRFAPEDPLKVSVAQCSYDIVSEDNGIYVLSYGHYRFKAWNGPITRKRVIGKEVTEFEDRCGWIEYTGIVDGTQ